MPSIERRKKRSDAHFSGTYGGAPCRLLRHWLNRSSASVGGFRIPLQTQQKLHTKKE